MKIQEQFKLHRFNDLVAFSCDDTPTLYITPHMAKQLASVLTDIVDDIDEVKFTESNIPTITITEEGLIGTKFEYAGANYRVDDFSGTAILATRIDHGTGRGNQTIFDYEFVIKLLEEIQDYEDNRKSNN